jgi:hypothetical protein
VNEVGGGIGEFEHPLFYVPQWRGRDRFVHDPDPRMIEAERNGVLVVDQQGRLRERRLLQETGKSLAGNRVPGIGSHQAVDLHRTDRAGLLEGRLMSAS